MAYSKSVRMDIALNGFKSTGIWPCDKNKFDDDFLLNINNQELSSVVTYKKETESSINEIQDLLNTNENLYLPEVCYNN